MVDVLVVFAGLPGVGKTTISGSLCRRTGASFVRIDAIESGLRRTGLVPPGGLGATGYEIAHHVVRSMLLQQLHVVVDAVNPVGEARRGWSDLANELDVRLLSVEVVCGDSDVHRRRVEQRTADLPGHDLPTWHDVVDLPYEPWPDVDLVVDSTRPTDDVVGEILRRLEPLGGR